MKAVIMAGGEGTRLRPLTTGIPKPMVPIINKPVMEHIINLLKKFKIYDITATLYYLPSAITDYFGNGKEFGVDLHYSTEVTPLGTGGSVLNVKDFLDSTFIVISGDALTDVDIDDALKFHKEKKSIATLILKKEPVPLEYGIVIIDESGRIIRFLEKPSWGEVFSDTVNTGIYILEPEVFDYYKKGDVFDFSRDLFPKLLKDNMPMYGYITDRYWCDIGDILTYKETSFDILKNLVEVNKYYNEISPNIFVGEGTIVSNTVQINPPVLIGNNCIIKDNVLLDSFTIIGDGCTIEANSSLKRSILWNNSHIGKKVQCRGTIICNKVTIQDNSNLYEGSVIGHECYISQKVTIKPDVKIWPFKNIKEDSIVSKNLVWGDGTSKNLFGNCGICGSFNVEITPEFVSLIGSAFASLIKKDTPIIVSSDGQNASDLLKNSLLSGVSSAGVGVINIGSSTIPINRFAVKFYSASGGIHISCDNKGKDIIHIEFINENGGNIDRSTEKKIEQLFLRQDFERCNSNSIKPIINVENFSSLYILNSLNNIKNLTEIKRNRPKIIIASANNNILSISLSLFEQMGCYVEYEHLDNSKNINNYIKHISTIVKKRNMDIGAIISSSGEDLTLIDNLGRIINKERYIILAALILLKSGRTKKIVVPYNTTMAVEDIAKQYGAHVIRTKLSTSSIMNEMLKNTEDEGYILQYILNFDGVYALAKILDYLTEHSLLLSSLVDEIPAFYLDKKEIKCDFTDKGRIIRMLIEESRNKNIELFEGIKINTDKGWALVLPDNEKPVLNIFSEGYCEEYASEISQTIIDKINFLLKIRD
ncbi:nucleotidyl transferase [Caloramator sp. E03]|uniref:sugar phosphate nucleotidyltransferase n=1 Tax=Caloramator sp. E03 TaxID=2576307 RepID=UPI0011100B62|nr:nucleotidyl transferase [Caloramator sp. E03]